MTNTIYTKLAVDETALVTTCEELQATIVNVEGCIVSMTYINNGGLFRRCEMLSTSLEEFIAYASEILSASNFKKHLKDLDEQQKQTVFDKMHLINEIKETKHKLDVMIEYEKAFAIVDSIPTHYDNGTRLTNTHEKQLLLEQMPQLLVMKKDLEKLFSKVGAFVN